MKFSQIYYRLIYKILRHKVADLTPVTISENIKREWVKQSLGIPKFLSADTCRFLNRQGTITKKEDWNSELKPKLWLYNLHYFDDLVSVGAGSRRDIQKLWMDNWVSQNPPVHGNGWEPYPTSLRIVNWIKAFLDDLPPKQAWLESLTKQTDYLSQKLEYHLLGNHLFANGKALIFSGAYLDCSAASHWLKKGIQIVDFELDEQILSDGAHFELTPMYHSIMLTDLLDIMNIIRTYPSKFPTELQDKIRSKIPAMLQFLADMSHCDGKLSFFNDTAMSIAPDNEHIYEYAGKLGFAKPQIAYNELQIIDYPKSGYVIAKSSLVSLISDLSLIGPSYLPGHAHADMLSFEMSIRGQRIFVNSGISEYGSGEERHRQRKTRSHNTVEINNKDSCELWSGFRVARRGLITNRNVDTSKFEFSAGHTGFKKQGIDCLHSRVWKLQDFGLTITDKLDGSFASARGYLHLHPSICILDINENSLLITDQVSRIILKFEGAKLYTSETTWHPEFGLALPTHKIMYEFEVSVVKIYISWK